MTTSQKPNRLHKEASPYLKQHAMNPVDWFPWGEEALTKARQENKPILVSIGYAACHWCHVMERQSFESPEIAAVMNEHLVSIKIDREERPDLDQIYMDAVQYMGMQGGWPLNVFLTPDGKPFYGGTYFPPDKWSRLVADIGKAFKERNAEIEESAEELTRALQRKETDKYGLHTADFSWSLEGMDRAFQQLSQSFDTEMGGMNRAPKFPMPSIWLYLLQYYHLSGKKEALQQVNLTLQKMAFGGIHDQVGGGFARYSVDGNWFVPHFEKMLYDNGQLLSLYTQAYSATLDILYRDVAYDMVSFVRRVYTSYEGGFFSALDADSEGEEGKFYVWTKKQVEEVLETDAELFCQLFEITDEGNWEHGNNILFRSLSQEEMADKHNLSHPTMHQFVQNCKKKLLFARNERQRPALDTKIISSWNGLMLNGLVDAYRVFDNPEMLKLAYDNAEFLRNKMMQEDGQIFRIYADGKCSIPGFLDDYAHVALAFTNLYQATFKEEWLFEAEKLLNYAIAHFWDESESLFFYTSDLAETLIARKKELFDNVIPSSNSMMAHALYNLGILLENQDYLDKAKSMVNRVGKMLNVDIQYLSNWAIVAAQMASQTAEIAIVGPNFMKFRKEIDKSFYPNKILTGTQSESKLPLLANRTADGNTLIFVCYNKTCQLPVDNVSAAFRQMKVKQNRNKETNIQT
jgi:uncharacterized protein YyaL (SSP411 family)